MEIFSSNFSLQVANKGKEPTIKAGDMSLIVVKERTGGNEAMVLFKGQEISVKFDGPLPSGDRALVEVKGQTPDGKAILKMVVAPEKGSQSVADVLRMAGFEPAYYSELKEVVQQILSRGGKVSKESLTQLQEFLQTEVDALSEKLETIKFIQERGLEFTKTALQSVHAAVNDPKAIVDFFEKFTDQQYQVKQGDSKIVAVDSEPIATPATMIAPAIIDEKTKKISEASVPLLPVSGQNVLVTRISEKLSQLTQDFSNVRKELVWSLDAAVKLLEAKNMPQATQNLEVTISKLDKTILKGDFMLYANLSTEKELLSASTKLAEARNLLNKGDFVQADQIVKEVKGRVEQLTFRPSEQKILRFTAEQPPQSAAQLVTKTILETKQEARSIFEIVKAIGLTHEADAAEALTDKRELPANLKSLVLQERSSGEPKVAQQALASITGQQLLSRQDTFGAQNLFLQLPILLNKHVENVQVLVNSKKAGEKIDWENCNLYFVLETKKLGEIGILLSATSRNLSITFKNDQNALKEFVEPLTEEMRENLQEIGYQVGVVQYKRLTANTEMAQPVQPASVKQKGFDLTV